MNGRRVLVFKLLLLSLAILVAQKVAATTPLAFPANPSTEDLRRARVFEESLMPVGGEPTSQENAALAAALVAYSKRTAPDDVSSLTRFLGKHPRSPWRTALLTSLGLEYYKAAYYSLALDAWREAWALGQKATDISGKFLADRALCELAGLYSRLGRMSDLEALLKAAEGRIFVGGATERISLAREALWMMQYRPGVSFRCGPLALQSIQRSLKPNEPGDMAIFNSASTQQGFSLSQVAELSKEIGLNYQMARRGKNGDFVIPSVVHWRVGHFAALVRQVGDQYLLEDPTFGSRVWATRRALEAETSGYFLIPPGELLHGWKSVDEKEGSSIWGKGITSGNDPDNYTPDDLQTGGCGGGIGMAVSSIHLMLANLQIRDTPVGYTPPVGPPVQFTVRYNHRDYLQQAGAIFGPKWTHDWNARIRDNPNNPLADVKYIVGGGGARTFTGFDTNTQTFAPQQRDHTRLRRIDAGLAAAYEMTFPDGSKMFFGHRIGLSSDVVLTQIMDAAGNAVTLGYDSFERLVAITDAIGQTTTLAYEYAGNSNLITRVTDPFGRFATFEYSNRVAGYTFSGTCGANLSVSTNYLPRLEKITDVLGLTSAVTYDQRAVTYINYDPLTDTWCTNHYGYTGDSITSLTTPYGVTTFSVGQGPQTNFTMRFVETQYPDGSRERVEYNQSEHLGIAGSEPAPTVPQGMSTWNQFLYARNTYHWSRTACAMAYGDYSKAKIYHWLHAENLTTTAGVLESTKQPLERRVWYDYDGQPGPYGVGSTDRPRHIGRVLDDGTTQIYTYAYNAFGHPTTTVDPLGRTFAFIYGTNGIDLVETRQTRAGNNELLFKADYNAQHRPLTTMDAAGQTNTYTYNARGQLLTETNPKNETTTYTYDPNGYLNSTDGPLPGTSDLITYTYDSFGRLRTIAGVTGYTLVFDYDSLDRLVRVTYPDSTFRQYTYERLDLVELRDRDGRHTLLEYDSVRQLRKETDPLGRVTLFSWCQCGSMKSLIDPMGRMTEWHSDVQGRLVSKQYSDGSKISHSYENTTSRLRQVIDERQQVTHFAYNRDNTLKSVAYANAVIPTPAVGYTYDTNYQRVVSMADGFGTTLYSYHPITGGPSFGAGQVATVDGPLPNDNITYGYDALGRPITTAINGVASTLAYDALGRVISETNALGSFAYGYEGSSPRLTSLTFPNNQTEERAYFNNVQDLLLQRITHRANGAPVSQFIYSHHAPAGRIATWSQQVGALTPNLHTFGYDDVNQLLSSTVTTAGTSSVAFTYGYDQAGNRLSEQVESSNYVATYNTLNQISTRNGPGMPRTYEWDAEDRLLAVTLGNERTEFTYDAHHRRIGIRKLVNGSEVSLRRFVWCDDEICEERNSGGAIVKRYFAQGVEIEAGPVTGTFYYTRDHLGSIRELTDSSGSVRARYAYDPYGRRTRLTGDMDADFGFAGMFWSPEVNLSLTLFRAYDPEVGRWLSRDPLGDAEVAQGPNLYAYVANDPVNVIDSLGLERDIVAEHADLLRKRNPRAAEMYLRRQALDKTRQPKLRPSSTLWPSTGGDVLEAGGGVVEVKKKPHYFWNRLRHKASPLPIVRPVPTPAPRLPGIVAAPGAFLEMGMTVLTMANCDVAEGIFALMRVRRGELANKYENAMMKELQKDLW